MITPTVGRIVYYHPVLRGISAGDPGPDPRGQPLAAVVAHVWSDTCVNLAVFDANGVPYSRTSVTLLQDDQVAASGEYGPGGYAEWMPFQKGQAAKTEALEAKIAEPPSPPPYVPEVAVL